MRRERSRIATIDSGAALAVVGLLDARGLDGMAIARQAGLSEATVKDPEARITLEVHNRLFRLAADATNDPCFGLDIPAHIVPGSSHGLFYAMMASPTLKEMLERFALYWPVVSMVGRMDFRAHGDGYRIVLDFTPQFDDETVDAAMALVLHDCRFIGTDPTFTPLAVRFMRAEPPCAERFHEFFRVRVRFGEPRNEIDFAREVMERPLPSGHGDLARDLDRVVSAYLARIEPQATSSRVRDAVVSALPSGEPSQTAIARQVGMSIRNLQRRLSAEGTSFSAIVEEAREHLARCYVDEGRRAAEVAYLLGFGDASAFSRAFRRWTGTTPTAYATRHNGRAMTG